MRKIFGIIAGIGFLFMIGSIGAMECNNVGLLQGSLQAAAGVLMLGGGIVGLNRLGDA